MAHAVYTEIDDIAKQEGVTLTSGAREMLAIPVIEQFPSDTEEQWEIVRLNIVRSSIKLIIVAVKEENDRHPRDSTQGRLNARAIIRGFWRQFCNIPPFCARAETRERR